MPSFEKDIEACLTVLRNGGLILYPTDTIWGIGCDATNEAAVEKILELKKRPEQKAMIALVADDRDILQHVASPDPGIFDFLEKLDRPTTIIYDGALGFASNLIAPDGSIGIRVCKDEFCRHLLKRFRKPIVSTSANISGQPAATNFSEINAEIIKGVDYVVKYRQEEKIKAAPSRIVRWKNGEAIIIR